MKLTRLKVILTFAFSIFSALNMFAQPPATCVDVQKSLDRVNRYVSSWTTVQEVFGQPARIDNDQSGRIILSYFYTGCSAKFYLDPEGRVSSKLFSLDSSVFANPRSQGLGAGTTIPQSHPRPQDLTSAILSLQTTIAELQKQIGELNQLVESLKAASPRSHSGRSAVIRQTGSALKKPVAGELQADFARE
jgi:hypothetical protein